jgi:hypothetical protein
LTFIPLLGGAYQAESVIASAQRCVNLYQERIPQDEKEPSPSTHYQTPGLVTKAQGDNLPVRGIYRASNGNAYCVIGLKVYSISPGFVLTQLGTLDTAKTTPVSMIDNGTDLLLVDGSPFGYNITLASNAFAKVVDPTGSFTGADKVDFLDTFIIFNVPGTPTYGSTRSGTPITFDPLFFAAKSDYPDLLATLAVIHREIWLLGTLTSEVWYNAGNVQLPFAELPGTFANHGTVAKYSAAVEDKSVFWLGQNLQGAGMVFRGMDYAVRRISTHAIEVAIQNYPRIDDAIGFCYQQYGHVFYVLSFPTAGKTWVYDDATDLWHERMWLDANGVPGRHRANCHAFIHGKNVVGDYQNGKLYALEPETYTDDGAPIQRIRSFPHIRNDAKRMNYTMFQADLDVGAELDPAGDPMISLRYSDTKGKTWSNALVHSMGKLGQFNMQAQYRRLGTSRDKIFELSWSAPVKTALNGAFIDFIPAAT